MGQTQVNPRVDMTFARGLRAILRQDPDVVMIGEIRDGETAQIAVQASLTGHRSCLRCTPTVRRGPSPVCGIWGWSPFNWFVATGVIAQRLVRRLCPHCRTTSPLDDNEKALFSFMDKPPKAIYRAVGCDQCRQSGYQGRAAFTSFWWSTAPCAAPFMKIKMRCPLRPSCSNRPTACAKTG